MSWKVILPGGGFHDVPPITIMTDQIVEGQGSYFAHISLKVLKRIEKHYCGIEDCRCRSIPTIQLGDGDHAWIQIPKSEALKAG